MVHTAQSGPVCPSPHAAALLRGAYPCLMLDACCCDPRDTYGTVVERVFPFDSEVTEAFLAQVRAMRHK